jgi:hypothetical protein
MPNGSNNNGKRMEKHLMNNPVTEQISMEKRSFTLCQQCSNNWRDACLVTKPELVRSKVGIEECSHYFQKKTKLKGNKW